MDAIEILVKCRLIFEALERGGFLDYDAVDAPLGGFEEEIKEVIADIHNFFDENDLNR